MPTGNRHVFVNCPFDGEYQPFFHAIVFVVIRSGFDPRCALETDDSSENSQDIHSHQGKIAALIEELAGWLRNHRRDPTVPGGRKMAQEFSVFRKQMPRICARRKLEPEELTFGDYADMIAEYIAEVA
jgi:hypothetical protein